MRPDPGLRLQLEVQAGMSEAARGQVRRRLARRGRLLAWQQADAAGPMTELERAEFLLRRLYPTFPESQLRQVLDQLATAQSSGAWSGFERPEPCPEEDR